MKASQSIKTSFALFLMSMVCSFSANADYDISGPSSDADGLFTLTVSNLGNFATDALQRRVQGGSWSTVKSVMTTESSFTYDEDLSGQSGVYEYRASGFSPCSGCSSGDGPVFTVNVGSSSPSSSGSSSSGSSSSGSSSSGGGASPTPPPNIAPPPPVRSAGRYADRYRSYGTVYERVDTPNSYTTIRTFHHGSVDVATATVVNQYGSELCTQEILHDLFYISGGTCETWRLMAPTLQRIPPPPTDFRFESLEGRRIYILAPNKPFKLVWSESEDAYNYELIVTLGSSVTNVGPVYNREHWYTSGLAAGNLSIRIRACNYDGWCGAYATKTIERASPVSAGEVQQNYFYDALGRLISVHENYEGKADYDYDPAGNRKTVDEYE